ncbi:MAG: EF-hand domain-containing protein [Proteobacteria bacterium]|nr:EF-hand domain-containing protein [Pseudomonadota bacterium]
MVPAALLASGAASLFSSGLSALGQSFVNKSDKDKSGGVSLGEFSELLQGGKNLPGSKDASATSVTPTEATKAKFAKIDTDANGSLSAEEVNAYNQQLVQQLQAALVDLQQMYGAGQNGAQQGGHHKHGGLADKLSAIDTNGDSSVSKDELSAFFAAQSGNATSAANRASQIFAKADTNNDGALSKDELSAFDATRKKKKKGQEGTDQIATLLQALDQANASLTTKASSALAATNAYKSAA